MPTSRAPRILLLVVLLTGLMMADLAAPNSPWSPPSATASPPAIPTGRARTATAACHPPVAEATGNLCRRSCRALAATPSSRTGAGAAMTATGLARIDSVPHRQHPRYILLMEGTNELYYGSAGGSGQSRHHDRQSCGRGIIPILGTFPLTRAIRKKHPRSQCTAQGTRPQQEHRPGRSLRSLIDNWSRLSWTDGFHPNTAGYATMAQVWSDAMKTPDLTPILMLLLDE